MQKKIIVIGGGMAGTSAAHHLLKRGYEVTIIEKNGRLGGRVRSEIHDGIAVEYGAGFITNMYSNMLRYLKEQGLSNRLCPYWSLPGIFRGGHVKMFSFANVFNARIVSWRAKFLLPISLLGPLRHWHAFDPLHAERLAEYDDASVAEHYRSKTGKEVLEYLVQPILTATFHWLPDVAKRTSEAILLFCAKALVVRGGTYLFQGGLQRIPETLAKGSSVLLNRIVIQVKKTEDGTYTVTLRDENDVEETLTADGVVCATTATTVLRIFRNLASYQRIFFEGIRYTSVSYLGRTYREKDVRGNRGIVFPPSEGLAITHIATLREPDTENKNSSVASVKASIAGTLYEQGDDVVLHTLTKGLGRAHSALFFGNPEPLSTFTWHWEEMLPIMEVGYFKRLKAFLAEEEKSDEPLVFAGDYLSSPFMEGAFSSGMRAAERLHTIFQADR